MTNGAKPHKEEAKAKPKQADSKKAKQPKPGKSK